MVRLVGPHLGLLDSEEGGVIDADASLENEPGVLFDALVVMSGADAVNALARDVRALEHVRDAYRHGKPLLFVVGASAVLDAAGLALLDHDPLLLLADAADDAVITAFVSAIAAHRNSARERSLVTP